jgi:hypothetical protein
VPLGRALIHDEDRGALGRQEVVQKLVVELAFVRDVTDQWPQTWIPECFEDEP